MLPFKLPNAAAHNITVTATATGLLDLINTAAGETINFKHDLSAIQLTLEDGDIRYTDNGSNPTATTGKLLSQGGDYSINAIPKDVKLIRTGSTNVKVSVRIGWARD